MHLVGIKLRPPGSVHLRQRLPLLCCFLSGAFCLGGFLSRAGWFSGLLGANSCMGWLIQFNPYASPVCYFEPSLPKSPPLGIPRWQAVTLYPHPNWTIVQPQALDRGVNIHITTHELLSLFRYMLQIIGEQRLAFVWQYYGLLTLLCVIVGWLIVFIFLSCFCHQMMTHRRIRRLRGALLHLD